MNYQKFKSAGVQGIFRHCERYQNSNGEYIKFGNQNIDIDLTPYNYNLGPRYKGTQYEHMKSILDNLEYRKQKNNTVLCGWTITAPKDLRPNDLKKFFEVAYKQLCKQVGGEHKVISSYVHMDETTPHMHFLFVPEFLDISKGMPRRTLSAGKLTTKAILERAHDDMQSVIDEAFPGQFYKIVNDSQSRAQGSVALEDYKAIKNQCDALQVRYDRLEEQHRNLITELSITGAKVKKAQQEYKKIVTQANAIIQDIQNKKFECDNQIIMRGKTAAQKFNEVEKYIDDLHNKAKLSEYEYDELLKLVDEGYNKFNETDNLGFTVEELEDCPLYDYTKFDDEELEL